MFEKQIGAENVIRGEPVMGGEDFSHFGRSGVPSLMYFLGVVDQRRLERFEQLGIPSPSLHSPSFYPDIDAALTTGMVTMTSAVLDLMRPEE